MGVNRSNFKTRGDLHLARKLWHVATVFLMAFIYHRVERPVALGILSITMVIFIGLDLLRLKFEPLNFVIIKIFSPIIRQNELHAPAGTTYLLSGVFISVVLFPKDLVLLTLLFLAIADPLASYVGIRWGKDKIVNNKSLQGTLAAFVGCTSMAFIYFHLKGFLLERILLTSLISGIIGAVSELVPIYKFDDNLTFPVLCSLALWIMFNIFT